MYCRGEFRIHPSLKKDPEATVKNAEWMKIEKEMIKKEGEKHWRTPFNSPLGHSTYLAVIIIFPLLTFYLPSGNYYIPPFDILHTKR